MAYSLEGKTVFITGASSGIGKSCAELFASEGANLLLAARRLNRIEKLAGELVTKYHIEAKAGGLDVRDEAAVNQFISSLNEPWKDIAVLVNNAGLARGLGAFHEGDVEDWNEMIDTNVKGLLHVSKAVIPGMLERGGGHVINTGSNAGREAYQGAGVYCASKFAVVALTETMRKDYYKTPVRFTVINPGLVETEFSEVRFHGDREMAAGVYEGIKPLSPDDVADTIVFAATRPPHVNLNEIWLMPTNQGSATLAHRVK